MPLPTFSTTGPLRIVAVEPIFRFRKAEVLGLLPSTDFGGLQ